MYQEWVKVYNKEQLAHLLALFLYVLIILGKSLKTWI